MKIKSISYERKNTVVHNFHCEPNENYFANGVLVHNCYKSNTTKGTYMTLETFKKLFNKLPKSLTQIAFGADARLVSNPDLIDIMNYTRQHGVIPNITAANIDDKTAGKLADICGAVAISVYDDKNIAYDSVERLVNNGLKQVNLHFMLSDETLERAYEVINDIKTDSRLTGLNAIVFLSLKQKGRGEKFTPVEQSDFTILVQHAFYRNVNIGFDSCGSLKFFKALTESQYEEYKNLVMPCESTLESSYINVNAEFFPCSFTEGNEEWKTGIDILNCNDFIEDVWNHPRINSFREKLLSTKCNNKFECRECPYFTV